MTQKARMHIGGSRSGRQHATTAVRPFLMLILSLAVSASGCAKEPTLVAVSAMTVNYSEEYLIDVSVGGKKAGSLSKPAKRGQVTGGGVYCCVSLPPNTPTTAVQIRSVGSDGVEKTYVIQAIIKLPWPEIANYAVFHMLPGHRVVIELAPGYVIPDPGRLEELDKFSKEGK
jgi:hypothetical protein